MSKEHSPIKNRVPCVPFTLRAPAPLSPHGPAANLLRHSIQRAIFACMPDLSDIYIAIFVLIVK